MRRIVSFVAVGALLAACQRKSDEPAPVATAAAPPASAEAPRAEYHEEPFDLSIAPAGPLAAGKPGVVEIHLGAKGGYHVNDKYPYKFRVEPTPGVKYASDVFAKDAVSLEPMKATMKIDLVPESKGAHAVTGTLSFSVCSAERCLVEKRNLSANVLVD